jgi:hypothetical protein
LSAGQASLVPTSTFPQRPPAWGARWATMSFVSNIWSSCH